MEEHPDPEFALMQRVKSVCGSWIDEAVNGTPYPPALLAALAANETGGDPTKSRFESTVYVSLSQVLVGLRENFGSITKVPILEAVTTGYNEMSFPTTLLRLMNFATSWGPTQIMGYQAIAGGYSIAELTNLQTCFKRTREMLEAFAKQWKILSGVVLVPGMVAFPDAVSEAFFRCWNTGKPTGVTFDACYVLNGLMRMKIYQLLA
jgi:hypothetical protein